MGSRGTEIDGQATAENTPEDVAVLYSWANLQGAKYRDYSASRREYRAQVRYRAAKALLERELKAQEGAEAAAMEAEREALAATASAHSELGDESPAARLQSLRSAEVAARKAAAERVEAARRAESAAHAAVLALREEREIAEAHSSAQRQAKVYEESEHRRRQLAGPQPRIPRGESNSGDTDNLQQFLGQRLPDAREAGGEATHDMLGGSHREFPAEAGGREETAGLTLTAAAQGELQRAGFDDVGDEASLEPVGPAWLYASQTPPQARVLQTISQVYKGELAGGDTLQDSREKVAARWFALKGVFENVGPELPAMQLVRASGALTPVLAVFSLAGGVGKTTLVATLGRALSVEGEKVVLADTTAHGLLPIYFGARDIHPGVLRTFPPPAESAGQPVSLVIYDLAGESEDERHQEALAEEILKSGQGNHRLLLDLSSGSSWLIRSVANLRPTVLVPMAPDMNSVISLQAVERLFRGLTDSDGRPVLPFYVLNHFDATLPLHLDVREVLRRQLGDRLLRIAIRRSQAVSEALAEGMTVVDYAPDAPVTQDFLEVALWLRSVSPPAMTAESRSVRWGER
jgi:cellulose synthase operon protein YhjQ